jgi:glucose-1-phosphate thymidylyltransferase
MSFSAVLMVCDAGSRPHRPGRVALTAVEHVANRPIVHHALDSLRAAGAERIILAGQAAALLKVRETFSGTLPRAEDLEYVVCGPEPMLGQTLEAVAPLVGDSPCLVHPADGLLDEPIGPLVELLRAELADLVLLASSEHTVATSHSEAAGRTAIIHSARAGCESAVAGLFGPGVLSRVSELVPSDAAADLRLAAKRLIGDGGQVALHEVHGWHRYRGHDSDLLELNRVALDALARNGQGREWQAQLGEDNEISSHVFIDPRATARSSVIVGPTVIGPGVTLADSYIGPYTSIGAGARIEGSEIERSIIAPDATILHIGARLVSSLVGRNTRVFRDFSLPQAIKLTIGDGDEIALC